MVRRSVENHTVSETPLHHLMRPSWHIGHVYYIECIPLMHVSDGYLCERSLYLVRYVYIPYTVN
jgi:hypothetical protein